MKFCCTHVIVPGGMQKCRFSFSSCMSFIFAFLCAGEFFFSLLVASVLVLECTRLTPTLRTHSKL